VHIGFSFFFFFFFFGYNLNNIYIFFAYNFTMTYVFNLKRSSQIHKHMTIMLIELNAKLVIGLLNECDHVHNNFV